MPGMHVLNKARPKIGNICIIGKYRYRYICSDISNIVIGMIGIGICYQNYIISYDIGIGISQDYTDTMKISIGNRYFTEYIGISIIIGIGLGDEG